MIVQRRRNSAMHFEERIKNIIRSIHKPTWILFFIGLMVYSPFIVNQLNCADVNVYGYVYHSSYGYENDLGRFLIKYFDMWRNSIVCTVLIIILSIFLTCLVGEITANSFDINNDIMRFLIGAAILFSPSVANLFSYGYTVDSYSFAFLLSSVAGLLLIKGNEKKDYAFAIVLMSMSVAIYQAYIGYSVILITVYLLKELLCNDSFDKEKKGFKQIALPVIRTIKGYAAILVSMIVYLVVFNILDAVGYLSKDQGRGLDNALGNFVSGFFSTLVKVYRYFFEYYFSTKVINNAWFGRRYLNIVVFLLLLTGMAYLIIKNKVYKNVFRLLISAVAVLIIPAILGFVFLIAPENTIYQETGLLMVPYIGFAYVLLLVFAEATERPLIKYSGMLIAILLTLIMTVFIQCFAKLIELEQVQFTQLANRIVYRIEEIDDFECGEEILVVGRPHNGNYPVPDRLLEDITKGMISHYTQIFGAEDQISKGWPAAIKYYLGVDFSECPPEKRSALINSEAVRNMGIYPATDSVQKIDDTIVIKLSEWDPR